MPILTAVETILYMKSAAVIEVERGEGAAMRMVDSFWLKVPKIVLKSGT